MKYLSVLVLVLFAYSCTSNKAKETNNFTYWVNSTKTTCSGVGEQQCLMVQKSETINPENWQMFYSNIEGFEFEPGYIYKLIVNEKKLKKEAVPADAPTIKYTLVKVLEKNIDKRLRINDIWFLTSIKGEAIETTQNKKIPRIEFNVAKMKVMGTDGCNNFNGSIKNLETETIEFGPIASTRKFCPNNTISDRFNALLNKTSGYKIENLHLILFDVSGNELLSFRKSD